MPGSASFCFHGALNDFLSSSRRDTWIEYAFFGSPAVKDAIEAIGIPHPEIKRVLVNSASASLSYRLQPGDRVEVFPHDASGLQVTGAARFVLDVHLGTLTRMLRMLGFDARYENDFTDKTIAAIAEAENRIVLTRDVGLLKNKAITQGYWLRSQQTGEQAEEVIRHFSLLKQVKPFERCLVCNGRIVEVAKEKVLDQLPPKTRLYFNEFYQCSACQRVYWKGSHYERMQELVRKLERELKV